MYFPYLRGRQYELSALRELLLSNRLSEKIIPIVEPEKPTLALLKTIEAFCEQKHKIAIIYNPKGKDFWTELDESKDKISMGLKEALNKREICIQAYVMSKEISYAISQNPNKSNFMIINDDRDSLDFYLDAYDNESEKPKYVLMPNERSYKRVLGNVNRIILEDNFNKKIRNADYADKVDEFFSDTHLYYADDGYFGFSDYSIIGKDLSLSGFAPRAVVIHIVYFDKKNELRIHHFVSDSNDGIENPARKFYEAATKMKTWCDKHQIVNTSGLSGFYECMEKGRYPGLGMVKKFSIMHHMELMGNYFGSM